jgi:hypothetical protein
VAGQPVTITFEAKAEVADQLQFGIQQSVSPYVWYGWSTANIGPTPSLPTYTFTPTATDPNAQFHFVLGGQVDEVHLARVIVTYGALQTYALTVSVDGGGTAMSAPSGIDCGATCSAAFAPGAEVTLTVTPAAGESFTGWSAPCSGTGTCLVTMSAAENVTATFTNTTSTRNVLLPPFAANSIWNMPIGSAAVYQPANITSPPNSVSNDDDILVFTPTAPSTPVVQNGAAWQGGVDRCDLNTWPTTPAGFSVPIPTDFILPGTDGDNESGAILLADGQTIKQFQPVSRCVDGGPVVFTDAYGVDGSLFPDGNLYGDGIAGSHGGSGMSSLGGGLSALVSSYPATARSSTALPM